MYYQPDLSYSHRIFKMLLVASIVVHGAVLFYKNSKTTLSLNSPEFLSATSIQIQLRNTPQEVVKTVPVKKKVLKKKIIKKVSKTPIQKQEKVQQDTQAVARVQKKSFKSFIENFVHPQYPRLAKRRGITGRVELLLTVHGNGQLKDIRVAKSSGHSILDDSALTAAKRWTFKRISSKTNQTFQLSKAVVYKLN
ncbi:MAG: energy transducer TonB [Halobacteriovoraceae bacterium]|nr:energy transducer TonB [Halobacteriovoraceae bacterium]